MTRVAPLGRAAPLSSTRRFDPESPIRWLVRAHFGDTGLCGSERGERSDVGSTASNGESGAAASLLGGAPRAQARGRAKVPLGHPLLRQPPLAAQLHRASDGREHRAHASSTATHTRDEDDRGAPTRHRAARGSTGRQGPPEGCDLPRFRPALLRSGTQGCLVRVPPFDTRAERPVPRPFPDGLERTTALRARRDGAPTGACGPQVLRRLRTRLEPVELQAGVRLLLEAQEAFVANCGSARRSWVSFRALFC